MKKQLIQTIITSVFFVVLLLWSKGEETLAAFPDPSSVAIPHSQSNFELCGVGEVTTLITCSRNHDPSFTNLVIIKNFECSGLVAIPETAISAVRVQTERSGRGDGSL
jgi:hypothetical protein